MLVDKEQYSQTNGINLGSFVGCLKAQLKKKKSFTLKAYYMFNSFLLYYQNQWNLPKSPNLRPH